MYVQAVRERASLARVTPEAQLPSARPFIVLVKKKGKRENGSSRRAGDLGTLDISRIIARNGQIIERISSER